MPANALVQILIDRFVKERAAAMLKEQGITVSDAVRILLTRTANEGVLPFILAGARQASMTLAIAAAWRFHVSASSESALRPRAVIM
jgi:addiction module RelB/DinJ family antitoxin